MVLALEKYIEQQNGIDSIQINPLIHGKLIYHKVAKNIQWGKDSLFNKQCWENWIIKCKRVKLGSYVTPNTRINPKGIKDLNLRPESKKFPEENIEDNLLDISDISLCNEFFGFDTHTHKGNKRKSKQVGLYQTKDFCTRESINKIKDNLPNERKFLQITLIDKRLIFNIQRSHITQ